MTTTTLLNFNGTDGSTTFTDDTGNNTWSVAGTGAVCELDTAEFKGGVSSLKVDQDSHVKSILTTPISGVFQIEFWFKKDPSVTTGSLVLLEFFQGTSYYWQIYLNVSSKTIYLYSPYYGSYSIVALSNADLNQWLHVTIVRTIDDKMYGQFIGTYSNAGTIGPGAAFSGDIDTILIGNTEKGVNIGFTGWIDGFRITDEPVYLSGSTAAVLAEPGLTYSILPIGYRYNDTPSKGIISDQAYITPFVGVDKSTIIFLGESGSTPVVNSNPVQYWG